MSLVLDAGLEPVDLMAMAEAGWEVRDAVADSWERGEDACVCLVQARVYGGWAVCGDAVALADAQAALQQAGGECQCAACAEDAQAGAEAAAAEAMRLRREGV